MNFNPLSFKNIALKISSSLRSNKNIPLDEEEKEAWIRTGISRSYYAAFLIAREKLSLKNYTKPDIHKLVIEKLSNIDPIIKDKLSELRRKRNYADYNIKISMKINDLIWSLATAQHIIKQLIKT